MVLNDERLTDNELADFLQRASVQLVPELTQQLLSLGTELTEYRDKIEQGTLKEQKTGKWLIERECGGIGQPYCYHCSVCDEEFNHIDIKIKYPYCPYCGAKMQN